MLYMLARYGNGAGQIDTGVIEGRVQTLMGWAKLDPPSESERTRNQQVAKLQGNANPLINSADLIDRVGVDGFRAWVRMGADAREQAIEQAMAGTASLDI